MLCSVPITISIIIIIICIITIHTNYIILLSLPEAEVVDGLVGPVARTAAVLILGYLSDYLQLFMYIYIYIYTYIYIYQLCMCIYIYIYI